MRGGEVRAALVDAVLAGLVAAAMALPMLGVRLEDSASGLSLSNRLDWVLWSAAIVAGGRLAIGLLRRVLADKVPSMPAPPRRVMVYLGWAMVAFALVLPFLPFAGRNVVDKATLVLIYVMLGWGLNIVVGLAGLLDLGFVAFYAVGAYSYALLSQTFGLSFWVCLPLAGLLAALFGMVLGFPVLRLRGDYIAIVTMGLGEIIRVVLQNWQDVTGGPNGISGIERPSFFGLSFKMVPPEGQKGFAEFFGLEYSADHRVMFLYFLILVLALLTNLFTLRIRRLPVGRAWEALREDEIACRSLGINPTTVKLSAFATGAMFAGFAGSFFATRQGFISPESFTFIESAVILAIVVLGGMGSQIGIVLAALLLVGLPEWFRELQQFRMLAFGAAMVLIMLWKPSGLLSTREPTIRLKDAS
ncbi:leucine/isoleucine/valine transporter subunit; membrane component of ABC superfamily [Magnetospirillum sp. XM-1]|uniref:high-affinity branched-chain amino acid ABC transporter permease LivM n=1 Tax=Magnetospirillum sp. XM-1 TaxID=1663591 RepID=UPI00073E04D9|nr:high-affinity branched-chain amino acid ABC transporter permease LivM [Magnetospirillum sp. XM-1]CUW40680.1 leucine/isoleucine/valine transporter subunit; membrane component of ABC superfamily [Magnetospirillum sp. XM-1]